MTLEESKKLLDEEYERAKRLEYVINPLAYALYQVWKKADTVRKMHSEIKERCIKGGIYPAFVASTIDQIEKEMLEEKSNDS